MFYTGRLICTVVFINIGTLQEQNILFKKQQQQHNYKYYHFIIIFSLENICGRKIHAAKGLNANKLSSFDVKFQNALWKYTLVYTEGQLK